MNTSYAHLAVDIFHSNFYSIASKWQKQIINFRWYMRNGFGHRKFTRHKYQVQVIYSNIQQTWGAIEKQWKKTRLSSGHQIECKKCHLCLLSALAIACSRAFTTLNKQQRSLFGWSIFFQSNNKKTDKKKGMKACIHWLLWVHYRHTLVSLQMLVWWTQWHGILANTAAPVAACLLSPLLPMQPPPPPSMPRRISYTAQRHINRTLSRMSCARFCVFMFCVCLKLWQNDRTNAKTMRSTKWHRHHHQPIH